MKLSRRVLLAGMSMAGLWGLACCGSDENLELLEVLTSDPMADEQLLGLELISSESHGYRKTMGKSDYAQLIHHFEIPTTADDTLARAVTEAETAGWVAEAPINESSLGTWRGAKNSPRRTCALTIIDNGQLLLDLTNLETP